MKPLVVVLSAPSGAGKTTIAQGLLARRKDVGYSVSATTRRPRAGERDGAAYHFVSWDEFARQRERGEFLEAAQYAGEWYGTLKGEVERVLASGRHVVLDIEIEGARQVRRAYPPPASVSVFILPPSAAVLIERLRRRKSETAPALAQRLERAVVELGEASQYDYIVVNDDLATAVAAVSAIIDGRSPPPQRGRRGRTAKRSGSTPSAGSWRRPPAAWFTRSKELECES